jgi:uncharacterized surface protein with fasciclin (FAS1) repeats
MRLLLTLSLSFLLLFAVGCPAPPESGANNATTDANAENKAENAENKTEDKTADNTENKDGESADAKDIVDTAAGNEDFKTLVAAVTAAGLVETLKGDGPFTVFAPTNAAFEKLPKGTVEDLLKEENKDKLKGILTYHVVAGKLDSKAVAEAIKKGDGKATLKTVQGEDLTASLDGEKVIITDAKGGKSTITKVDVMTSNGVIHVLDTVIMPAK